MAEENQEAEDQAEGAEGEGEEGEEGEGGKKKSSKLLIIIIAAVVVIGAAGGGAFFFLQKGSEAEEEVEAEPTPEELAASAAASTAFYEVPEMLVNLSVTGSVPRYLKIKVALEIGSEADIPRLEKVMPRVVDDFQVYLRQLRAEDLQGSAGIYRLKEALLMRANQSAQPLEIKNVLFTEMLIQ